MKEEPLVSIIIINHNGKTHLSACLNSLKKIHYKNYEVIIVDNNSTDGSVDFLKKNHPTIKLIQFDENYGFAKPNNHAAKKADGDLLLFLNNDTVVTENFLNELVSTITSDNKIAICQSLLLKMNNDVDSSGDFIDNLGRAYRSLNKPTERRQILSARGASMIVKKDIFWELGGFDEKFFVSFEDIDLGWRSWISGYVVFLEPNSIVYHIGGQTTKQKKPQTQFHGVKNNLILRLTNFETSYTIKNLFMFFLINSVKKFSGYSVVNDVEPILELPSFKIIFKAMFWTLKNTGYILKKRKLVNSKRIRSTKDLIELGIIKNPA